MAKHKNKKDYSQREVGWLVTKEHADAERPNTSRVGWGQLRVHADETGLSFDRMVGHTIFMDKSLTEHMIPTELQIRWRSFDDDGTPCYDGIVTVNWLLGDDPERGDLAYNIDRFNYNDTGAVHVYYSVEDIIRLAKEHERPDWEAFALRRKAMKQLDNGFSNWIEIYA